MLNAVIFSKDRACQLDFLLRSIKLQWKDYFKYKISIILWNATNQSFQEGYDVLKKEHPEFNFVAKTDFKSDMISLVSPDNPYTMFFVDDLVFKESFELMCPEFHAFEDNDDIMCLSLRMHPRIRYCQPRKIDTPPPQLNSDLTWKWEGLQGDWGYPYSIDAHIFRTKDVIDVVRNAPYTYPNNFEDCLLNFMARRPLVKCFEKSKVVNIPLNLVGPTTSPNRNVSAESLNTEYLKGKRLSFKNVLDIDTISPHQEIALDWEEEQKPIKYHLGCGGNYLEGYVNVDFPQSEHTIVNIKADQYENLLTIKLKPCNEIMSHHVFEHFNYIESIVLLVKWAQALKTKGLLVISIPDIEVLSEELNKAISENYIRRVFMLMRLLYGSHEAEWAYHINGWSVGTLSYIMEKMGFNLESADRYGDRNSDFPNVGIAMKLVKEKEVPDLKEVAREFLSYYTLMPAEQSLLNEFNKQYDRMLSC